MMSHQEWLNSFKSDNFSFVYLGDDKTFTIIGKGKIKIALDDGGVYTLSGEHYVLELRKNWNSPGTLQANGYSFRSY